MTTLPSIKECVKGVVKFTHFQSQNLWYVCENGFTFPVPVDDTGDGMFLPEDKGLFFMRYIRLHLKYLASAKEENADD